MTRSCHDRVLFVFRASGDPLGVATLTQKIEAEKRMRDLLAEHDMPQPDFVEYGFGCIRLFFNRTKHVVIIDIDEDDEAALDEAPP